MELQLGKFTVTAQEGAGCALKAVREKGGVTEYEFAFSWTEENAAADAEFKVSWEDMVPGSLYKWDSRCNLHRDTSAHWDDIFASMISSLAPVACYFDGEGINS